MGKKKNGWIDGQNDIRSSENDMGLSWRIEGAADLSVSGCK